MATDQHPSSTSSSNRTAAIATTVAPSRSWCRVGYLLPRMLVACIALDALMRLAPSSWRPMEPGEAVVRHRQSGEAFARYLRGYSPAAYGDLARIGNLEEL